MKAINNFKMRLQEIGRQSSGNIITGPLLGLLFIIFFPFIAVLTIISIGVYWIFRMFDALNRKVSYKPLTHSK